MSSSASSNVTGTPARASPSAVISPTGPPPTIKTSVMLRLSLLTELRAPFLNSSLISIRSDTHFFGRFTYQRHRLSSLFTALQESAADSRRDQRDHERDHQPDELNPRSPASTIRNCLIETLIGLSRARRLRAPHAKA